MDCFKGETFNDVMFVPQYSEVESRSNISTLTDMGFFKLDLPLIAANMKDICGPKMAVRMCKMGGLGILHRFGTIEESVKDFKEAERLIENEGIYANPPEWLENQYSVGVSVGVKDYEKERFIALYDAGASLFTVDVAHGHHILVKKMIKFMRERCGNNVCIIAGNVATPEGARDLREWGADIVKVGIGPGCFVKGTLVKTKNGHKNIEDIEDGCEVLTHRGRYKKVIGTAIRKTKKTIKINNIECTPNHEFYVLNKKYKCIVNDDNINQYAEWVNAEDLTKDYFLLEVKEG